MEKGNKLSANTNKSFNDVDPNDVGDVAKGIVSIAKTVVKIIKDWKK